MKTTKQIIEEARERFNKLSFMTSDLYPNELCEIALKIQKEEFLKEIDDWFKSCDSLADGLEITNGKDVPEWFMFNEDDIEELKQKLKDGGVE